jgi:hypothetical protein
MKDRKMMKDGEADNKKVDAAPVKGEAGTNEATPATEVNNTLPDEAPAPEESKSEKNGMPPEQDDNPPASVSVEHTENTPEAEGPDFEAAIAEAEQRGYLRGRNERIEELMQRPGIMERPGTTEINRADTKGEQGFLSHLKVSIWDR